MGKTRLVEELISRLDAEQTVAAVGCCIEVGGDEFPSPRSPRRCASCGSGCPPGTGGERGSGGPARPDSADLDAVPSLERRGRRPGAPLRTHHADPGVPRVEPPDRAGDRGSTLGRLSTRSLLAYLLRTRAPARFLLIGTYRSDRFTAGTACSSSWRRRTGSGRCASVELSRFNRVETIKQLSGLFGQRLARPGSAQRGSSPALRRRQRVLRRGTCTGPTATQAGARARARLDNLRDVLLVRLEALPETSQRIARIAAESRPPASATRC